MDLKLIIGPYLWKNKTILCDRLRSQTLSIHSFSQSALNISSLVAFATKTFITTQQSGQL